jgi:aspartate 1-decarboxylase
MRLRTFLRSKIHRATVTEANVDYIGSITLDEDLMEAADVAEYEQVLIADLENGERLETYVIRGQRGSGVVGINGAAALRIGVGDKIIIFAYMQISDEELAGFKPKIIFVDERNRVTNVARLETPETRMA